VHVLVLLFGVKTVRNGRKTLKPLQFFFVRNEIENGYSGNRNAISISEISETNVRYEKYIDIGRSLNTIGEPINIKISQYKKFTMQQSLQIS
jgi:hypothetical protein